MPDFIHTSPHSTHADSLCLWLRGCDSAALWACAAAVADTVYRRQRGQHTQRCCSAFYLNLPGVPIVPNNSCGVLSGNQVYPTPYCPYGAKNRF